MSLRHLCSMFIGTAILFNTTMASDIIVTDESLKSLAAKERQFAEKEAAYLDCLVGQKENSAELKAFFNDAKTKLAKKAKAIVKRDLENLACTSEKLEKLKSSLEKISLESKSLKDKIKLKAATYSDKILTTEIGPRQENDNEFFSVASKEFLNCPQRDFSREELNDALLLHGFYLAYGHTCTVKNFKTSSMKVNKSSELQSSFDAYADKKLENFNEESLKDMNFAVVPSLVYEKRYAYRIPIFGGMFYTPDPQDPDAISQKESMTMDQFCKRLKKFGVNNCKVMYRVTTAPMKEQAEDTYKELLKFSKKKSKGKPFYVLAQSAGAHVMNFIFKNYSREQLKVLKDKGFKGIFNVGGTPRGSAIAEYKVGGDHFYGKELKGSFATLNNAGAIQQLGLKLMAALGPNTSPKAVKRFIKLAENSLEKDNVKALSFMNEATSYDSSELTDSSFTSEIKVYNLISVVEDLKDLTKSSDPVIIQQYMYGPTEGSSLLADSAIESKTASRIFYNRDHLVFFRSMDRDEFTNFYLKLLVSAKEAGFFN